MLYMLFIVVHYCKLYHSSVNVGGAVPGTSLMGTIGILCKFAVNLDALPVAVH